MKKQTVKFWVVLAVLVAIAGAAHADDVAEASVVLSNHMFAPQELIVPAGKKIKLTIVNKDASNAEFESAELNREKVIPASGQIYIYIGPLDAGAYDYYDDFHRATTSGKIVAQENKEGSK